MKVIIPKDSADEARFYLKAWMDMHDDPGIDRTKRMILVLQILSLCAGVALVAGVFLAWHPIVIGVAGMILGYTGAETASLKSRMRSWPHNEKYFDWEAIREALHSPEPVPDEN